MRPMTRRVRLGPNQAARAVFDGMFDRVDRRPARKLRRQGRYAEAGAAEAGIKRSSRLRGDLAAPAHSAPGGLTEG